MKKVEKQRALTPSVGTVPVPTYYWEMMKTAITELKRLNSQTEHEWRASRLSIQHRAEELEEYAKSVEALR